MPQLNPQMAEILALMEQAMKDRPERVSLSPIEARAQMNAIFEAFWNADRPTLWAVYPDGDSASRDAYGDGRYIISNEDLRWFWGLYLNGEADRRNPLAAPLLADLRNLPTLLVTACEFDPLRGDSERLARRLEEAGVPHRYALWPGVTHACIHMTRMLDVAQQHIEDMASWLRERLA